jgi:hypothetical protein
MRGASDGNDLLANRPLRYTILLVDVTWESRSQAGSLPLSAILRRRAGFTIRVVSDGDSVSEGHLMVSARASGIAQ